MYYRIVAALHQWDSYGISMEHVIYTHYNIYIYTYISYKQHFRKGELQRLIPKIPNVHWRRLQGNVLLRCTGSVAHESLHGRRIHYDSQELIGASFQWESPWETMGITLGTSMMMYCLYYPLPTALDLEFQQPSKTFYVRYVAARLQDLWEGWFVKPLWTQWFTNDF